MTIPTDIPPPDRSPGQISGAKPLENDLLTSKQPGQLPFQAYMEGGSVGEKVPGQAAPTPMSLSRPTSTPTTAPTMDSLTQQAKSAQDGLGVVEDQLHTLKGAKVQMKRSQSNLLKNKLTNVRETGANVAEKIGANPKAMTHPKEGGALEKFLTYVGDGQNQFIAIQDKLKELSASDKPINPADMLLVQTKMGIAQQEIEYSSTLLGKVMTSMTTIMNIQL